MLRTILLLLLVSYHLTAESIPIPSDYQTKQFIGEWNFKETQKLKKSVVVKTDMNIHYHDNENYAFFAYVTFEYEAKLSEYNSANLKFENDNVVIASYLLFGSGKWYLGTQKSMSQNMEMLQLFNNANFNKITLSSMPITKREADKIMLEMKKSYQKDRRDDFEILKVSRNQIELASQQKNRILKLKRIK